MDSFGKLVKAGLSKAYAVGEQHIQQRVARRTSQERPSDCPAPSPLRHGHEGQHYTQPSSNLGSPQYGYSNTTAAVYTTEQNGLYFPPPPSSAPRPARAESSYGPPQKSSGALHGGSSGNQSVPYAGYPSQEHSPSSLHYQPRPSTQHDHAAPLATSASNHGPAMLPVPAAGTTYGHQSGFHQTQGNAIPASNGVISDTAQARVTQEQDYSYYQPPTGSLPPYHQSSSSAYGDTNSTRYPGELGQQGQHGIPPAVPPRKPLGAMCASPPTRGESDIPQGAGVTRPTQDAPAPHENSWTELHAQMNNLRMNSGGEHGPRQSATAVADREPRRQPAAMKAVGTPCDIVRFCPEERVVDYSLYWYHLPDVPECFICTRCHAESIEGTSLAPQFQRVKRPPGSLSTCGFWYPRIKDTLWPQALRSNGLDSMRAFMKRRLDIPHCKGRVVVTGAEGVKWYGMAANDIDSFIACEACYEDRVVGTLFATRFTRYRQQGPDEKWTCDMCVPYISRAVAEFSKLNDWPAFVAGSTRRLRLPACEAKEVQSNTVTWYHPRRTIEKMHVCEACFMDKLEKTQFEDQFQPQTPVSGFDAFIEQLGQTRTCTLADSAISMRSALEAAIRQRDYSVFWNAAREICSLVPCTANGIIRGNWWTLAGGCDDLSVCEACHTGILLSIGVDKFFEPARRDGEATIVCGFCIESPRFAQFLAKLAEALDRGVFSYYSDYVKKYAGVQAYHGIKHREKTRWWGYPEALFCQDCFLSFVANTALADDLPIKGEYDERAHICQIWSPRMRNMWTKVCAAGAPGSEESKAALDEFRAFGSRWLQVYLQTVPQMDFIMRMKRLKMTNAMHQGMLSIMYSGMNSQAAISGTTDGYWHGSSSLGWYETEHGATGAQMFNNMQAGMSDANRADEWMQMAQLEMMWKEVE